MPKAKLDAALCLVATCPEHKTKEVYWDTAITGFTLEVRPNGGKTYYLRYWDEGGSQRQIKIGGYADITFDQARKKAQRLRSEVTLGGDPAAKKEERKAIPTYAELAKQHLAHAESYQRSHGDLESIMRLHGRRPATGLAAVWRGRQHRSTASSAQPRGGRSTRDCRPDRSDLC